MARQPVLNKSAGTRQRITDMVMPAAVAIAEIEKAVRAHQKALRARLEVERRIIDQVGHRVPGVTEIAKHVVDLDLERFGVQLAERTLPEDGDQRFYPGHSVDPSNDGN